MPWHDVACCLYGPPAHDVATHFIQRYNKVVKETLLVCGNNYFSRQCTGIQCTGMESVLVYSVLVYMQCTGRLCTGIHAVYWCTCSVLVYSVLVYSVFVDSVLGR